MVEILRANASYGKTKEREKADEGNWQGQYSAKCLYGSIKSRRLVTCVLVFLGVDNFMSVDVAIIPFQEKASRFHSSQLALLDRSRMPRHIAIIPDGNRRWAKKRLSHIQAGHREGADTLMETVKAAQELKIEKMTFYSFSTENWNRSPQEVTALLALISAYLLEQQEEMIEWGIKLETIGDLSALPSFLLEVIEQTKEVTKECDKISLILALNYGSRNEICRAFRTMLEDYDRHTLNKEEINETTIARYLDIMNLVMRSIRINGCA
jgi:undecaprenyl diphosphate synthase